MELTITRDGEADLIESGLIFNEARHRLHRVDDWASFLNRELDRKDLFTYWHREAGSHVLCGWVVRGKACVELCTFQVPPGHFDTDIPAFDLVKDMVRPAHEKAAAARRAIQAARSRRESLRLDSVEERASVAAHYRRSGSSGTGALLDAGGKFVGRREGGDEHAAVTEQIVTAAKLASRSDGPWYDHLKPKKPAGGDA